VLVDGVSVGAVASHTFANVTADHTIAASFEATPNLAVLPYQEHWEDFEPGASPVGQDGWDASSPGAAVVEAVSYSYAHARPPLDPAPDRTNQVLRLTGEAGAVAHRLAPLSEAEHIVWDAMVVLNPMTDEQAHDALLGDEELKTGFYINPEGRLTLLHLDATVATNRLTVLDDGYDALADGAWARVTVAFDFASDPEGGRFFRFGLHGVFLAHPLGLTEPNRQAGQPGGTWFLCPNQEAGIRVVEFTGNAQLDDYRITAEAPGETPKQTQFIAFDAIPDTVVTQTLALAATASSGLPVGFVVTEGPGVLDGTSLSFTASGYVTVQAAQGGNAAFLAAAPVDRRFAVLTEEGILDAGGNGVDDRWEQVYWPDGVPPATVVKRGRAVPLRDVFVADLDPFDEDSVLEITRFGLLWRDGDWHAELDFGPASVRRLYDVESSPDVTGGWQRVRGDIAPEGSSVRLETPAAEEGRRFYRIQVRLPPPVE